MLIFSVWVPIYYAHNTRLYNIGGDFITKHTCSNSVGVHYGVLKYRFVEISIFVNEKRFYDVALMTNIILNYLYYS